VKPGSPPPPIPSEQASFRSEVRLLGIASSADLEPSRTLGDARGEEALALALGLKGAGYHVYACDLEGPQRLERVAALVRERLPGDRPLADWVYVHNFSEPARPRVLRLQAGEGARLRSDLESLLRDLREDLPKAFREEAFDEEKERVLSRLRERQREEETRLSALAEREHLGIEITSQGNITLVPLIDGHPVNEEQFEALPKAQKNQFEKSHERMHQELREHFQRSREERHRVDEEIRRIEREFARRLVKPRLDAVATSYGQSKLTAHLQDLLEHLLDHLEPFRASETPALPLPLSLLTGTDEPLAVYDVNVVVDNSRTGDPPTLVVDCPTYKSLFGTVDREVSRAGQLGTDFRKIRAGALLRAAGGAVVIDVVDALVEPFVWRNLHRTLRSGRIEIEAYDPFVFFTAVGLRPEPVEVDTRVVLVGPRWIFEMLLAADEEFEDVFKVLADFAPVVLRDEASTRAVCGRIAQLAREEELLPFEADALDALVEESVREAADRRRIHLGSERVLDAAREASAGARAEGRSGVTRAHVSAALLERTHRLDRIERSLRDAVERGLVLLDVTGKRVGQLNALSVIELGSRAFGRSGRVTASVGLGQRGVVNIEREAKLSGATHTKGILILEGFLRDRFARKRPLSLVASVAFEQSYGAVEGDSASLAELLAILSRIGGFPLRQDLAVTGSVNQIGEVQAVGGLNEKIEGFFDCCQVKGETGEQGVVIPASNVENLVLREDVARALEEGRFRVIPVRDVDEALEALTGQAAGCPDEPDSLNFAVDHALEEMAERLSRFGRPEPSADG
jgi:ATP-dependent Lon protease